MSGHVQVSDGGTAIAKVTPRVGRILPKARLAIEVCEDLYPTGPIQPDDLGKAVRVIAFVEGWHHDKVRVAETAQAAARIWAARS